ncbi:glycosyltransferase family 61 protein [Azotobacter chroococcum]|uniref:glycosyltransferase family 61 protein n=1 Tax=Azotobacter chroococcum TaxID=353 RepID=UPI0009E3BF33|nr:glycosyltransferase 61 family protein [Azotobacter chroococcum]
MTLQIPQTTMPFPANIINKFTGELPNWWGGPIKKLEPRVTIVYDGLVSAGKITGWPHNVISRVEGPSGELVVDSAFWRISRISMDPPDLNSQRTQATFCKGEYIYLGWLIGHYGHFLTESLSRYWYCLKSGATKKFVIHANFRKFSELPQHVASTLNCFGINESNLIIAHKPYRFECLHCPAPAIRCDDSSAPHLLHIYNHISKKLTHSQTQNFKNKKIYISRSSLSNNARQFNETEISRVFSDFGFTLISPENLSFEEQVGIYTNSEFMAGPVGSGVHNAVFMPQNSRLLVVAPNCFLFRNDSLLSSACNYDTSYHIVNSGSAKISQQGWQVDCHELSKSLNKWLSDT